MCNKNDWCFSATLLTRPSVWARAVLRVRPCWLWHSQTNMFSLHFTILNLSDDILCGSTLWSQNVSWHFSHAPLELFFLGGVFWEKESEWRWQSSCDRSVFCPHRRMEYSKEVTLGKGKWMIIALLIRIEMYYWKVKAWKEHFRADKWCCGEYRL